MCFVHAFFGDSCQAALWAPVDLKRCAHGEKSLLDSGTFMPAARTATSTIDIDTA